MQLIRTKKICLNRMWNISIQVIFKYTKNLKDGGLKIRDQLLRQILVLSRHMVIQSKLEQNLKVLLLWLTKNFLRALIEL